MTNDSVAIPSKGNHHQHPLGEEPKGIVIVGSDLEHHFPRVMSSQGATRSSSFSFSRTKSGSMKPVKDVEMESIQSRRARLEEITATMRLPPLAPGEGRLSAHHHPSPSVIHHGTSSLFGDQYHWRRRGPEMPEGSSRGHSAVMHVQPGTTKLPTLILPPMAPYHNPLPGIGQLRVPKEVNDEDDAHPGTNLESPPPPTYESAVQKPEEANDDNRTKDSVSEDDERPKSANPADSEADAEVKSNSSSAEEKDPTSPDFRRTVDKLKLDDVGKKVEALVEARNMLTSDNRSFIEAGLITPCVECLQIDHIDLQYEALWTLTNIASGTNEDTQAVADEGAVPYMIALLRSPSEPVREQSLWALSNIAGDSSELRNLVLEQGVLKPLLEMLHEDMPLRLKGNFAWMLCNLTLHKPLHFDKDDLQHLVTAIKFFLQPDDVSVLADTLCSLTYLTEGSPEAAQMIIDAGLCRRMVEFMTHDEDRIVQPAIRACGTFAAGTDVQTDHILKVGGLEAIKPSIRSSNDDVRRDAVWFTSNFTAGSQVQIQRVIDAGLLPEVVHAAEKGPFLVTREAVWALANLTKSGNADQMMALIKARGMQVLLNVLGTTAEGNVLQVALEGIYTILKATRNNASDYNFVREIAEENEGIELLETHLRSQVEEVKKLAHEILNTHFQDVDSTDETMIRILPDMESENMIRVLPDIENQKIIRTLSDIGIPMEEEEEEEDDIAEVEEVDIEMLEIEDDNVSKVSVQAMKYMPKESDKEEGQDEFKEEKGDGVT